MADLGKAIAHRRDMLTFKYIKPEGVIYKRKWVPDTASCFMCQGSGILVDPLEQYLDPACWLCEGRGWVSLRACKGCGRPAFHMVNSVIFCGRADCFEELTGEARTKPKLLAKGAAARPIDDNEWSEYEMYELFGASAVHYKTIDGVLCKLSGMCWVPVDEQALLPDDCCD